MDKWEPPIYREHKKELERLHSIGDFIMGMMKQEMIAATMGSQHTMYAAIKALGGVLSPDQEKFQDYLEAKYPEHVKTLVEEAEDIVGGSNAGE